MHLMHSKTQGIELAQTFTLTALFPLVKVSMITPAPATSDCTCLGHLGWCNR